MFGSLRDNVNAIFNLLASDLKADEETVLGERTRQAIRTARFNLNYALDGTTTCR